MSQQYLSAAAIVARIVNRTGGSVRSVYADDSARNKPATQAIVTQTLRYRAIVEELVSESSLRNRLTDNKPTEAERAKLCIWKWLAFVLIYEMLFGMGIKGGGYVQRVIKSSHAEFDRLLTALKERRGESDVRNLLPAVTPTPVMGRFARVNLLKVSVADALQELFARGFALEKADDGDEPVQSQRVRVDALVPYVLELAPGCDLHADPLVVRGALILQDKASCLPAAALAPPRHAVCVDACAAPGNKTTHLAALIAAPRDDSPRHSEDAEQGVVVAIDRDRTRLATLLRGVELAGASHLVVPYCDDFLRVSEAVATFGASAHARSLSKRRRPDTAQRMTAPASNADRARVQALLQRATHALVDPSCSGSGVVSRDASLGIDTVVDAGSDANRLHNLARFQRDVLVRALMLPRVTRAVYSTCSVHAVENEHVVRDVLRETRVRARAWRLARALPQWPRRGVVPSNDDDDDNNNNNNNNHAAGDVIDDVTLAEMCARTDAHLDRTSGFFVALFERDADNDDDDNQVPTEAAEPVRSAKGARKRVATVRDDDTPVAFPFDNARTRKRRLADARDGEPPTKRRQITPAARVVTGGADAHVSASSRRRRRATRRRLTRPLTQ